MRPGGFVGYVMSGPLAAAVTPWVAALLLALLVLYGLLLIEVLPCTGYRSASPSCA